MPTNIERIEGKLTLVDSDGRELSAYIVSAEHAARILAAWERGECGERYLCAGGSWIDCARSAGHEGSCSYRAD